MAIEGDIYDRLASQLGASVAAIYDTTRPEGEVLGALPVVVFQRISSDSTSVLPGPMALRETAFQVTVYCSEGFLTAGRAVREAVITALHNYRAGVFKGARHVNDFEVPPSEDIPEYQIPIDFTFTT